MFFLVHQKWICQWTKRTHASRDCSLQTWKVGWSRVQGPFRTPLETLGTQTHTHTQRQSSKPEIAFPNWCRAPSAERATHVHQLNVGWWLIDSGSIGSGHRNAWGQCGMPPLPNPHPCSSCCPSQASHCSTCCWCHLGLSHTWLPQKWGASWAINGFSPPPATPPATPEVLRVLLLLLLHTLFLRPSRDGILVMTSFGPGNWY